jgi:hypothetical protein
MKCRDYVMHERFALQGNKEAMRGNKYCKKHWMVFLQHSKHKLVLSQRKGSFGFSSPEVPAMSKWQSRLMSESVSLLTRWIATLVLGKKSLSKIFVKEDTIKKTFFYNRDVTFS